MPRTNEQPIIRVSGVSKSFRLPHQKITSLKGMFVNLFRRNPNYEKQTVLRDVSLSVYRGEFLGIVGRNGSGKSTLLKLLAQIYVPDKGSIAVNGTIAPFIELGVGFNPELTGRENVYLNGALLGFDRRQVDAMYEEIVAFAELERFMDQKLKNYSSGMQVRLAFSVAIKAHTEILLIDEVLAVGDANFQKKCYDTFENFKSEGRTIIFISHSMDSVRRFCDRAILLDDGEVRIEGETDVIAAEYELLNKESMKKHEDRLAIKNPREAHFVERILEQFSINDTLLELGMETNRNIELLRSLGLDVTGLDLTKGVLPRKPSGVTGLLLLDNRKSVTIDNLEKVSKELDGGRLASVKNIYIHLPFHRYQAQRELRRPGSNTHLAPPLDVQLVTTLFRRCGFETTRLDMYGTDEPLQYVEVFMEKIDQERILKLWPSLEG